MKKYLVFVEILIVLAIAATVAISMIQARQDAKKEAEQEALEAAQIATTSQTTDYTTDYVTNYATDYTTNYTTSTYSSPPSVSESMYQPEGENAVINEPTGVTSSGIGAGSVVTIEPGATFKGNSNFPCFEVSDELASKEWVVDGVYGDEAMISHTTDGHYYLLPNIKTHWLQDSGTTQSVNQYGTGSYPPATISESGTGAVTSNGHIIIR